jgi:hypothetical protein
VFYSAVSYQTFVIRCITICGNSRGTARAASNAACTVRNNTDFNITSTELQHHPDFISHLHGLNHQSSKRSGRLDELHILWRYILWRRTSCPSEWVLVLCFVGCRWFRLAHDTPSTFDNARMETLSIFWTQAYALQHLAATSNASNNQLITTVSTAGGSPSLQRQHSS